MHPRLISLSSTLHNTLIEKSLTIATAESCTAGLLSHVITAVSGSSEYFMGGVVAYSDQVKAIELNVQLKTLLQYGAVSKQSAYEMALGIRKKFKTDIGLSTTGIAGPTGGTPMKPVGLVWIGISTQKKTQAIECHFKGGREKVKTSAVEELLSRLLEHLDQYPSRISRR